MQKEKTSQPFLMRPGVNLFRQIRFKFKATLITTAFLVPVLILMWSFVDTKKEAINATKSELQGYSAVQAQIALSRAVQAYRRLVLVQHATAVPSDDVEKSKKQLLALVSNLAASSGSFFAGQKQADAVKEIDQLSSHLGTPADGLFKVFTSHGALAHTVNRLISSTADVSGLTLDPDIDTYYLMDVSSNILPTLIEATSKMQAIASTVARTGKDAEVASIELSQEQGLIEHVFEVFQDEIAKILLEHPEYKKELATDELNQLMKKFRDTVGDDVGKGGAQRGTEIDQQGEKIRQLFVQVQDQSLLHLGDLLQQRVAKLSRQFQLTLILVSLSLICALYMFVAFYRVMDSGLRHVGGFLLAMANGDLTAKIQPKGGDEVTELLRSLGQMQESFSGIVQVVRATSESIKDNSSDVAQGSMDMSQRTIQMQNRLQETAATMVEISSAVQANADNAEEAKRLSLENTSLARHSGEVIDKMQITMAGIRDSSTKIGDIISVIDGIAFQTNILALNAAVEAARAGEAGRGFAVVASEVRALAHRSAEAAKEIKQLISVSVERVEGGNLIVKNAGEAIERVVLSASEISQLLTDISASAREEAVGVKDIENVLQELDGVTSANSALVEQTSGSASELERHANQLVDKVNVFRLPV